MPNQTITPIEIDRRKIGPGYPTYFIAELSANHKQDYGEAEKLLRAAFEAGADAIKLQTYTPDTLTIDCDRDIFRHGGGSLWKHRTLYDLYQDAYMPWEWQPKLKKLADNLGITLFSTPFDLTAVDFLEKMAVPAYKISSFEIIDLPLIRRAAATGKPLIISTGMATIEEIEDAVNTVGDSGNNQLVLLKCTSSYPADPADMHLRTIPDLSARFNIPCGLSDHTTGAAIPIAAVTLGACVVEKHFTLSRADNTVDSAFSMEPAEFKEMVNEVRLVEKSLGSVHFGPSKRETESLSFRRSLFIVSDMRKGDVLTPENMRSIRPGQGLSPKHYDQVLGRRINRDVPKGTPLSWDLIETV